MNMKSKNLLCLFFSLLYTASVFAFTDLKSGAGPIASMLLTAAAPISLIIYILSEKSAGKWREWVVPVGFILRAVTVFSLGWNSAGLTVYDRINGTLIYLLFALQAIGVLLMAAGTLFNFEYAKLLKWGSAVFIASVAVGQLLGSILSVVGGGYGINPVEIIRFILLLLFHIAIFLFETEEKKA